MLSDCPREVPVECWAQMSDEERETVRSEVARRWYEREGQYWTDEQWVEMLKHVA